MSGEHVTSYVTPCGGCLIGFPRGTGLHNFGPGCRFAEVEPTAPAAQGKWSIWCHTNPPLGPCWLKGADGKPKLFDERINAIVAANSMRKQVRGLFRYAVRQYPGAP